MITNTRICPICGYDTEVNDSRYRERTGVIVRNRKCLNCKRYFKTVEIEKKVFDRLLSSDKIISGIKDFIEKGEKIDRDTETTS
jgi:transcriptional regulator NrdR family protein